MYDNKHEMVGTKIFGSIGRVPVVRLHPSEQIQADIDSVKRNIKIKTDT